MAIANKRTGNRIQLLLCTPYIEIKASFGSLYLYIIIIMHIYKLPHECFITATKNGLLFYALCFGIG